MALGKLEVAKAVVAAWSRGDLEMVHMYMDDEIEWHYMAGASPPVKGKAKALKFMTNFRGTLGEVNWRIFDCAEVGDRLFVEGVDEFVTKEGRRVVAPYAGVLQFRDGRIVAWRDYVDQGVMEAQRAGQPAPAWVEALADRPAL